MHYALEQSPMGRVYVPLEVPSGVALFYTSRDFDGYLDDQAVSVIRRFVEDRFGIDAAFWTCNQIHGMDAVRVKRGTTPRSWPLSPARRGDWGEGQWRECDGCDALWTSELDVALGIKVADCLPVTLVDPDHHVVANIHAGWRGTAARIAARVVERLQRESAFSAPAAHAFLGPSIRQCCFEVGWEVVDQFRGSYQNIENYVDRSRGERPYLDLVAVTTDVLIVHGLRRDSIHDSGLCTRCEGSLFHSYRRDHEKTGRNLAIVAQ